MFTDRLKEDYAYCEEVIKKESKSFYTAFSKLPEEKSQAVYAIYAFCRKADDTIDGRDPYEAKKENLITLSEELQEFALGNTPDHPIWRALQDVFQRYTMDIAPFFDQIEGQKQDLDFAAMATLADLENYSALVAGSVGLMLLPVIASQARQTDALKESALSLGIAMQLTNILRDVGEDFLENHRVYLPDELLEKHQVKLAAVIQNGPTPEFIQLWEEIAHESEKRYDRFYPFVQLYDADSRFPVLVSAKLYRAIMDSVRDNHYNCLTVRNYVSPKQMVRLAAEAKKYLSERHSLQ